MIEAPPTWDTRIQFEKYKLKEPKHRASSFTNTHKAPPPWRHCATDPRKRVDHTNGQSTDDTWGLLMLQKRAVSLVHFKGEFFGMRCISLLQKPKYYLFTSESWIQSTEHFRVAMDLCWASNTFRVFFRTVQWVSPVGPEGLPHPDWTTMLFMHLLMRLYVITSCHPTYCFFLPVLVLESQVGILDQLFI